MRRKFTCLFSLLFASTILVWGQTTHTVTSNADSGEGTLRNLIEIADAEDKIVIPNNYVITLESEIELPSKDVTIDGQGATIQVTQPGVSAWRLFNLSSGGSGTTPRELTLENLTLLGGDVTAATGNGGIILINKRVSLTLKNCVLKNGKAAKGGAIYTTASEGIEYFTLEDCTFDGNVNTGGNGAVYLRGVNASFKNCSFENNTSTTTSALYLELSGAAVDQPTILSGCYFKNNSTTGSGDSAASVYLKGATYTFNVNNCTFNGDNSAGSILFSSSSAKIVFTNSTFYNNSCGSNGRGAIYLKGASAKELVAINCTFAGNIGQRSSHGSAITTNDASTVVTLVNNIFAYNYGNGGFVDIYTANSSVSGTNNIIKGNRTVSGSIAFTYNTEDPTNDSPLFESYTTNSAGKIPVLDVVSKTIPLLGTTSVAYKAGVSTYASLAIPALDQYGQTRAAIPCIGSSEYVSTPTSIGEVEKSDEFRYWSENGNLIVVSDIACRVNIYAMDGRIVKNIELNKGLNTINGLAKGLYIINNKKIIIK